MPEQDINLIPQEEKKEQKKAHIVKMSTVFSVLVFFAVAGLSAYLFYQTTSVKTEIKANEDEITSFRADIQKLSDIEIIARNLGARQLSLRDVLSARFYYSDLLKEFYKRIPDTVDVQSFGFGPNGDTLTISGFAFDYMSISAFIRLLSNNSFADAEKGYENLFMDVALNSVNLDSQNNGANYFIEVGIDTTLLQK